MRCLLAITIAAVIFYSNCAAQEWSTPEAMRAFGKPGDSVNPDLLGRHGYNQENETPKATSRKIKKKQAEKKEAAIESPYVSAPKSSEWVGGSMTILPSSREQTSDHKINYDTRKSGWVAVSGSTTSGFNNILTYYNASSIEVVGNNKVTVNVKDFNDNPSEGQFRYSALINCSNYTHYVGSTEIIERSGRTLTLDINKNYDNRQGSVGYILCKSVCEYAASQTNKIRAH